MPPKKARKPRKPVTKSTNTKAKSSRKRAKIATPTPPPQLTGPLPTLVLDTGGYSIKHAVLYPESGQKSHQNLKPTHSPNLSAKPRHQLTTLLSSQIDTIQNKSQLVITRPLERGFVSDLGTQFQIWDYILNKESLDVKHSFSNGGVSGLMPSVSLKTQPKALPKTLTHTAAVFCLSQPFTPRSILEKEDEIWFRDFGFGRVTRRLGACCSAYKYLKEGEKASKCANDPKSTDSFTRKGIEDDETGCCCVVDCGFSVTFVVPTVDAKAVSKGIRRINIGGKLFTNLLKQSVSYSKFNMMDEFFLMNEAKEALCFFSTDFENEIRNVRDIPEGSRWFDREFVLPDHVNTFKGSVQLPAMLQHKKGGGVNEECDELINKNDDGNKDMEEESSSDSAGNNGNEESDDETEDQARKRILKQREEERLRQEKEELEKQVLPLSTERFAVPEVLFRPSDIGMEQLGIAEAIVQSIEACDTIYRAALYQNIILTGGNAKIPNFRERLQIELRSLAPSNCKIRVYLPDDPDSYAWLGSRELACEHGLMGSFYLDRSDWETRRQSGEATGDIWNSTLNCDTKNGMTLI